MYINVKIVEAYYLQISGVLRCEAGRVFTLVTVAWLIDCQCLVRLQGDTVLTITEHFFVWTHLSRGFWLGYIWSILNCIWSVSRTFVPTSRCGVGFHTFHHCLFPPSVCCLPRAKRPCIMYEGEGGPCLNLNVFTISFNHCGLWGFRKWIESCIQTLYFNVSTFFMN